MSLENITGTKRGIRTVPYIGLRRDSLESCHHIDLLACNRCFLFPPSRNAVLWHRAQFQMLNARGQTHSYPRCGGLRKPAGRETCQHSWGTRKLLVSAKVNGVEIISHALAFFLNPSQTFEALLKWV